MPGSVLQRLLSSGEYDEFEDVVIAEGEFVETDDHHLPIRQVILGMTPLNLLIACRLLPNYKETPEVYYQVDLDPFLDGLDLSSVVPLCVIRIHCSTAKYELAIRVHERINFYEMTNTRLNGCLEDTWARWQERATYIKEDPYNYIRALFDAHQLPYPEYYLTKQDNKFDAIDETDIYLLEKTDKASAKSRKKKQKKEKQNAKANDAVPKKKKGKFF